VWQSCGHGVVAGGVVASAHSHGGVRCNDSGSVVRFGDDRERKRRRKWKTRRGSGILLSQACKHDVVASYAHLGETRGGRTLPSVGHGLTEETESMLIVVTDIRSLSLHIS
jgi:formylmethanofuran dehydrogenase subunit A